jgi:GNAT superfamily N-acetyltransferase
MLLTAEIVCERGAVLLREATLHDLPLIRDIFARGNDVPYDLARVAEEKCFGAGVAGAPRVRIAEEHGVAVTCGRTLRVIAVDREHRGRGIGSALLEDSSATVIGAEAGNYFVAGVPAGSPMVNWLTNRGYEEKSRTSDLIVEQLERFSIPADVVRWTGEAPILHWIEQQFGPIWRFEVARASAFVVKEGRRIIGFSAHEGNNRGLGTFGPTGIAREYRGRGFGTLLLHASLADLYRMGYSRAIIPWTGAIDFYRKACGARVALDLVSMVRTTPR